VEPADGVTKEALRLKSDFNVFEYAPNCILNFSRLMFCFLEVVNPLGCYSTKNKNICGSNKLAYN